MKKMCVPVPFLLWKRHSKAHYLVLIPPKVV